MLFADTDLAARIEHAERELIRAGAAAVAVRNPDADVFVRELAGGLAAYCGSESPLNKVAGLGFGGPIEVAELESVEAEFARRGAPVQVELANLADPEIGAVLTSRGYVLRGFENVLGRDLAEVPDGPLAPGVEIAPIGPGELETWIDTVVTGFCTPDTQGVASQESYPREVIESAIRDLTGDPRFTFFLARRDGVVAGAGSLRLQDTVAQLAGAATLPEHRRRGVQTSLLQHRLASARDAGCEVGVVVTSPGTKSQQNVQREGFELLYTRAVLVRKPAR